jgi:hypothetical protein
MNVRSIAGHLLLPVIIVAAAGCSSKFVVKQVDPAKPFPHPMDGVVYALPRTVVHVNLPVIRVDSMPGLYGEFAQFFFLDAYEAENVVKEKKTGFKLGSPGFATTSEPDSTQVYYLQMAKGGSLFRDLTAKLEFDSGGALTSGSADVTNTAPEVAIATLNLVTGLLTRTALAAPLGGAGDLAGKTEAEKAALQKSADELIRACSKRLLASAQERKFLKAIGKADPVSARFTNHDDQLLYCQLRAPRDRLKGDYDFIGRITTAAERQDAAYRFRRAALAFRDIQSVLEKISSSISNGVAPQPSQTRAELTDLVQHQIEKFFTGSRSKSIWTGNFVVKPTGVGDSLLMSFSKNHGVCSIDAVQTSAGVVLDPDFLVDSCGGAGDSVEPIALRLEKLDSGDMADLARRGFTPKANQERGFAYRIPSPSIMIVRRGDNEIGRDQTRIAQFGIPVRFPASLGGWSTSYDFKSDSATGSLTSLNFGSKALVQKAMVEAAGTNANTLLDAARAKAEAEKKLKKAAEDAKSIDADLDLQKSRLEKQAAIIDACKKLNISCDLVVDSGGNALKKP